MKKPFKIEVKAPSHYRAFQMATNQIPVKQGYAELDTSAEDVIKAVDGKKRRAFDNPSLYTDKIQEYEQMLTRYQAAIKADSSALGQQRAVVDLILAHGDIRVDNIAKCAVRQMGPGLYCVFGYDFGA